MKKNLVLFICTMVFVFLVAEVAYRLTKFVIRGTWKPVTVISRDLGWISPPDYKTKSTRFVDASGKNYDRKYQTFKYGFRDWGNVSSNKPKIFFIGDSFTQCFDVSNENTYYGVFKKYFPSEIEIFAYGGGGYGTLQEYMIIDKYINQINPDVLVLQFCSNDFENNSFQSEAKSINLNQTIRPYLVEGEIFYRFSKWHPYPIMLRYSMFFSFLDVSVQQLRYKFTQDYNNKAVKFLNNESPYQVTSKIMAMIRKRVPKETRLYTFNCRGEGENEKIYKSFIEVAEKNGFTVIPGIAQAVRDAEVSGKVVRAADGGHLNNYGNEVMGRKLAHYFSSLFKRKNSE
jgi:lysophospholipase L1-like esterase